MDVLTTRTSRQQVALVLLTHSCPKQSFLVFGQVFTDASARQHRDDDIVPSSAYAPSNLHPLY